MRRVARLKVALWPASQHPLSVKRIPSEGSGASYQEMHGVSLSPLSVVEIGTGRSAAKEEKDGIEYVSSHASPQSDRKGKYSRTRLEEDKDGAKHKKIPFPTCTK